MSNLCLFLLCTLTNEYCYCCCFLLLDLCLSVFWTLRNWKFVTLDTQGGVPEWTMGTGECWCLHCYETKNRPAFFGVMSFNVWQLYYTTYVGQTTCTFLFLQHLRRTALYFDNFWHTDYLDKLAVKLQQNSPRAIWVK